MIVCEHVWFLSLGRVEKVYIYKPQNLRPYKLNLEYYRNYKKINLSITEYVLLEGNVSEYSEQLIQYLLKQVKQSHNTPMDADLQGGGGYIAPTHS
jgi:hypothetical protein